MPTIKPHKYLSSQNTTQIPAQTETGDCLRQSNRKIRALVSIDLWTDYIKLCPTCELFDPRIVPK